MGGRLALARADIEAPTGERYERAAVHVIGSTLRLLAGNRVLAEREGVERIERVDMTHWRIVMAQGNPWLVTRKKGCGCGR